MKLGVFRHDEDVILLEIGRPGGFNAPYPLVVVVVKTYRVIALLDLEAVEDPAANVAGSLERVAALAGEQYRLLVLCQLLAEVIVLGLAEQTASDCGHRDHRCIQLHEGVVGFAPFGPRSRYRIVQFCKDLIDAVDGNFKPAHCPFIDQRLPRLDVAVFHIDDGLGGAFPFFHRFQTTQFQSLGSHACGVHDGVVDYHDGDGCTADDVGLFALRLTSL